MMYCFSLAINSRLSRFLFALQIDIITVATKASSVARSLKLSNVDLG